MKKFLLLVMVFLCGINLYSQTEKNTEGAKAPNFVLENLDGDIIELNEEIGEGPILLSFWATWCKPCIEEMSHFHEIYEQYSEKGLKMFAISTDAEKTVSKVKPFIQSKGYNFPVLLDTNREAARDYFAQNIPFTVIIDKNGNIQYSHLGYKRGDEIEVTEIIKKLIK